jgi:hypothetical protein
MLHVLSQLWLKVTHTTLYHLRKEVQGDSDRKDWSDPNSNGGKSSRKEEFPELMKMRIPHKKYPNVFAAVR